MITTPGSEKGSTREPAGDLISGSILEILKRWSDRRVPVNNDAVGKHFTNLCAIPGWIIDAAFHQDEFAFHRSHSCLVNAWWRKQPDILLRIVREIERLIRYEHSLLSLEGFSLVLEFADVLVDPSGDDGRSMIVSEMLDFSVLLLRFLLSGWPIVPDFHSN